MIIFPLLIRDNLKLTLKGVFFLNTFVSVMRLEKMLHNVSLNLRKFCFPLKLFLFNKMLNLCFWRSELESVNYLTLKTV